MSLLRFPVCAISENEGRIRVRGAALSSLPVVSGRCIVDVGCHHIRHVRHQRKREQVKDFAGVLLLALLPGSHMIPDGERLLPGQVHEPGDDIHPNFPDELYI